MHFKMARTVHSFILKDLLSFSCVPDSSHFQGSSEADRQRRCFRSIQSCRQRHVCMGTQNIGAIDVIKDSLYKWIRELCVWELTHVDFLK